MATRTVTLIGCVIPLIWACGTEQQTDTNQPTASPPMNNRAPTIAGNPETAVLVQQTYSFTPDASDPDGDALTFQIQNLPSWGSFDASDGTLFGTPVAGDEGTYPDIVLSVNDGQESVALPSFGISVDQAANGSVTVSWIPPTQNDDGSPLTDLAGYRLYYGNAAGNHPNSIEIDNPGLSSYTVENLGNATYFFVATAINTAGTESDPSNEITKVVSSN